MQNYSYKILDNKGKISIGQIRAKSLNEAIKKLEQNSNSIISVEKAHARLREYSRKLKANELMLFYRELEIMYKSGLSLEKSFDILEKQAISIHSMKIFLYLKYAIKQGMTFSDALSRYPESFPKFHISIIKAAEEGGFLDKSLNQLALVVEKQNELIRRISSAMNYPAIVFATGIIGFILVFYIVFPNLELLIHTLNVKLPLYAEIIVDITKFIRKFYYIFPLIALIIYIFLKFNILEKDTITSKKNWERRKLAIPVIGELMKKESITHALIILSSLIKSNIRITQALELAGESTNNILVGSAFAEVADRIRSGKTIAVSFGESSEVFPKGLISMIYTGEVSGKLDNVIMHIVRLYEIELNAAIESAMRLIEPAVIIFLGIVFGLLLLSFFYPIYTSLTNF